MPLDPKLQKFTTASPIIATFDFTDIAEGTGIIVFNGSRVSIDATPANDLYILNKNEVVPSVIRTEGALDADFDITFNSSRIIGGAAFIVLPVRVTTSGASITITPKVKIIHYDGSTETEMVAQVTLEGLNRSSDGVTYVDRVLKVVIPDTHFAQGETLRVNIVTTSTGTGTIDLYHDPTGSTSEFTLSGGKLKVFIPFRIQV